MKWAELSSEQRNALVAEKVMGWQPKECDGEVMELHGWQCSCCGLSGDWTDDFNRFSGHIQLPPRYSESMDAAWKMVEKLRQQRFDIYIASAPLQYNALCMDRRMHGKSFEASANSAPEAICIAALRACGIEVEV